VVVETQPKYSRLHLLQLSTLNVARYRM